MFPITDTTTGLAIHLDHGYQTLTEQQAAVIELALHPDWTVDRHVTAGQGLGLMISPASVRAPEQLDMVFYVDAEAVGLCLSVMRDDELEHRGCYGSVGGLVAAIHAAA